MKNIPWLLILLCPFTSCSNQDKPIIVLGWETAMMCAPPVTTSYTDDMESQEIINYINSVGKEGDIDERYITGDALLKIIKTIEQGGNTGKQASKALVKLSRCFDGEYGRYYEDMCFQLASSNIPRKQWLVYVGGPSSYEEVKNQTIGRYLMYKDNALACIKFLEKDSDLSSWEKTKKLGYARENYRNASELYDRCLKAFGERT